MHLPFSPEYYLITLLQNWSRFRVYLASSMKSIFGFGFTEHVSSYFFLVFTGLAAGAVSPSLTYVCSSLPHRHPSTTLKSLKDPACLIAATHLFDFSSSIRVLVSLQLFTFIYACSLFFSSYIQKKFLTCV